MRGTLGRKPIENANIVDHELPVFGYHAGSSFPSVASVKSPTSSDFSEDCEAVSQMDDVERMPECREAAASY